MNLNSTSANIQAETKLKAEAIAQAMRPRTVLLPWLVTTGAILSLSIASMPWVILSVVTAYFILIMTYGSVTALNDLADHKTDIINKRTDIPLANGALSRPEVRLLFWILASSVMVLAALLHWQVLLWVLVYLLLGWLYSYGPAFKNRPLLSLAVLGYCYGVSPWLLAYSLTHTLTDDWVRGAIVILASFIFVFGIMPLKDYKDLNGDKQTGKNTLVVTKGTEFSLQFIRSLTTLAYGIVIFFAAWMQLGWPALLGALLLVINVGLFSDKRMIDNSKVRAKKGNLSRAMYFGYALLIFVLRGCNPIN